MEITELKKILRAFLFVSPSPVQIEDHRVSGADLAIVEADAVGEDDEEPVVVCPSREPPEDPFVTLVALELGLDGFGVVLAIVP